MYNPFSQPIGQPKYTVEVNKEAQIVTITYREDIECPCCGKIIDYRVITRQIPLKTFLKRQKKLYNIFVD